MASWTWVTWLSACLAFLMTGLLVTSRVSLMWLLRLYKYEQIHPATWYAIVLILLVTPHLIHLVKLSWDTPIISPANRERLPSASKIVIGILGSALEGMATAVFASEVTPVLPEPVLLTIPYASLAFYLITTVSRHLLKSKKGDQAGSKESQASNKRPPCCIQDFWCLVAALYTLCVPIAVGVLLNLWSSFSFNVPECTAMAIALITVAGVWSPDIQKATITSNNTNTRCQLVELVYVPVRIITIVSTLVLCLVFKLKDFRNNVEMFLSPVVVDFADFRVWLPIALCAISGFLSLACSIAASKIGLVTAGIKIPLFLCPIISMFTVIATWNDFQTQAFWELWGTDTLSWTAFGLSAITWLIPFCFPSLAILKSPCLPSREVKDSFISFSWQTFFLEPKMILNYQRCSVGKQCKCREGNPNGGKGKQEATSPRRKVVFICTTMYKESDKEMRRYINSIKDVMTNLLDDTIEIEAHVFFDGSVEEGQVNTRGRQLVYLLCETFGLTFAQLQKNKTPYGCQVHTGSLLSHPVYIHFKDTTKVKSKKRWSQVMYLHYLLQFRCKDKLRDSLPSKLINVDNHLSVIKSEEYIVSDKKLLSTTSNQTRTSNGLTATDGDKKHSLNSQPDHSIHRRGARKLSSSQCDEPTDRRCVKNWDSLSFFNHNDYLIVNPSRYDLQNTTTGRMPSYTDVPRAAHKSKGSEETLKSDMVDSGNTGAAVFTISTHRIDSFPSKFDVNTDNEIRPPSLPFDGRNSSTSEDVFLLTTDADTEFTSSSVADVIFQCQEDRSLGAVCGRTVPVGSPKPIVWYQKFEYAKDFWLVKASQNVIGSVTCCPGCFTLYRSSAISQVCHEFSQPTSSAFDSMVKDHGEDRWLCTLLMQRGWRLAYSTHAHNSTHCPETVGEFLRQRRRWVLSELSNMAAIFRTMPSLVRHNQSFSGMFILSLVMTFLWVISSPSTTLVFLCAGADVLFSVPLHVTVPSGLLFFMANTLVCCFASQRRQKLFVMVVSVVMATVVLALSVGFVLYVVRIMEKDLLIWGSVQFRPYFLVFLLVLAIVYAALLHPRESLSLVYGLSYALIFPAMFVILPVYALANMVDQSWGTREVGRRVCCQQPQEEEDGQAHKEFAIRISDLLSLSDRKECMDENSFWMTLKDNLIGVKVNVGVPNQTLSRDLKKLRRTCVSVFVFINVFWFICLSLLHAFTGRDVICYLVASILSFSLLLQLIGLTSYKCNSLIKKFLMGKNALALTFEATTPPGQCQC